MTVRSDGPETSSDCEPLLSPELRHHVPPRPNPLPKLQLAVVFFIKLVIPIAGTQTFPYINVLVADLAKASGAQTGYYSGLVVSSESPLTVTLQPDDSSREVPIQSRIYLPYTTGVTSLVNGVRLVSQQANRS